ncbi:hypothetical protein EMIT0P218_110002 [Pseudomonas sp. IT-P218]
MLRFAGRGLYHSVGTILQTCDELPLGYATQFAGSCNRIRYHSVNIRHPHFISASGPSGYRWCRRFFWSCACCCPFFCCLPPVSRC